MASKTHGERSDRLEQLVEIIGEDHLSLKEDPGSLKQLVADLATETRRGFDQVAARFDQVAAQFQETERRMRETDERIRQHARETDERIDKLVIAIGEFIRNQNAPRA
jgi:methyl-accepting chemotaxis protein